MFSEKYDKDEEKIYITREKDYYNYNVHWVIEDS